ncbi:PQQ-binding-like beta-propeller repeat protein [Halosolutus halophilus]|uniref:PQQ-binding-like beta-propeller repeat protein n=1 Tax=Halosolutus halophilus TaxID=1552990 RepID=UPI00223518C4|nr:PQQ-binding-like beta-propeller repeat protein [Halosolutus halophilus]
MPSRRALLTALGTATSAGMAGCVGQVRHALEDDPPVEGPCDEPAGTWPTAGGNPGRTGRADTAPPAPDADVVDLLAGVRDNGRQRLASSLPAVADGTAYLPVSGGLVAVALDAPADGPIWSHDLEDDVNAVPALACGVVLALGLNRLAALDPESGEKYWRADVGSHSKTAVASIDDTTYVAGVNPVAVDTRTGTIQWSAEGGDTLALDDGGVYTTRNANGTGGIFAHDLNGEERWHLSLGKIVGSASVLDGTVWVADNHGTVYAIDALTGETYWSRSPTGVGKIHSGLAVTGDDVIVPAGVGTTSVALDATTGETRWAVDTGIVTGRPVVGDDWVAFGRTNSGVTLYDRSTGEQRTTWSRSEYDLGTIDSLVAVEEGFVIREGTTSGLSLLR